MKAKDLLDTEDKWTRGIFACDADGQAVGSTEPSAVRWCILGALLHCYPGIDDFRSARTKVMNVIRVRYPASYDVAVFNDTREFVDIKAVLEEADV